MPAASLGSYINAAGTPRPVGAVALVKLNGEPMDGSDALRVLSSAPKNLPIDTATFTRPADVTAYAVGDLVANSTDAGSVVPLAFDVPEGITSVRAGSIMKSGTVLTNANFNLRLYSAAPVPSNGDNGPWLTASAAYIGSLSLSMASSGLVFTDGAFFSTAVNIVLPDGVTAVYGLLVVTGAYVPASGEVFTIALEGY